MPATLSFFDMSILSAPSGPYVPLPITLGPNWQPNDLRVFLQCVNVGTTSIVAAPPGFTSLYNNTSWGVDISYRRLVAGDTDTFLQYAAPSAFLFTSWVLFTARGCSPSVNPTAALNLPNGAFSSSVILPANSSTGGTVAAPPALSVPAAGAMVLWFFTWLTGGTGTNKSACSVGCPAGWANLVASASSGSTYTPFSGQPATMAVAQAFSGSGSTGTINLPYGAENGAGVSEAWIALPAAADVPITAGTAPTTTTTATAATFSVSTAVTPTVGSATTTTTATTAFNPLYGWWLSDPTTLTGQPVTGSVVRWTQTAPAAGSTVLVETSINNGVTWDVATNNGAVPRLLVGDTTTPNILQRITLTRVLASDAAPEVLLLEIQVSTNASTDELVPVGHGMIDKVTVNAAGGTAGTGTVTNTTSSTAVISRGGGQTGGATSIKLHVTDLSGSIKRNVWAMPYTVPAGLNYGAAAKAMVLSRLPDQTAFAISSTSRVTPLLVYGMQQGGDPWQDIQDLATAIGFEAFFDAKGVFTFRPVPNPAVGPAVWAFDETGVLLVAEATRELSNDQTFNNIIVVGQSTSSSNPVTAQAFDNNPSSPTYILGPFGTKTERLTFSTIITQDQAQAAANALLYNSLGGADTVTLTVVPQPALEPGDIVKVNVSNVEATGNYMINSMTTSLSPADPQQLVCFRQSTS